MEIKLVIQKQQLDEDMIIPLAETMDWNLAEKNL